MKIGYLVAGGLCLLLGMAIGETFGAELDITRHGRYIVFTPDNKPYSEHNEIHVAFESAGNCSLEYKTRCTVAPIGYSVLLKADPGDCPACPECPDPEPCPDCPDCPEIPDPPKPEVHDVTVEWTPPTTRENGNTISGVDPDALDFYTIQWRTGTSEPESTRINHPATSYTYEDFAPGVWQFRVSVTDKTELTSEWTDWLTAVVGDGCLDRGELQNFVCERFEPGVLCTWDRYCAPVELEQYHFDFNPDEQPNGWTPLKTVDGERGGYLITNDELVPSTQTDGGKYQSGHRARAVGQPWPDEQWIDRTHRGDPAVLQEWLAQ